MGHREVGEGGDVGGGLAQHGFDLGELAAEHAGDGVELFAHVLGVWLGEDGADRGGDHLCGALGHLGEHVAQEVHSTPLPGGPDQHGVNGTAQSGMLGRQFPKVETMLREAAADITAFADFPVAHWKKIWSTNPLERLNKEIKRRTDVVGVFPNPAALLRLAGSVLVEAHDEWQVADKRYLSETSLALLDVSDQSAETIAPTAALTA